MNFHDISWDAPWIIIIIIYRGVKYLNILNRAVRVHLYGKLMWLMHLTHPDK